MLRLTIATAFLAGIVAASPVAGQAQEGVISHAIAMHGEPRYGAEFSHFDYANPDAPRGGTLSQGVVGSFDSLNPFIVLGRSAAGVRPYLFAQLMARSWDEPFSLYPYVAESIEVPADRSWVTFRLNPAAEFHDGTPITADDVVFTMEALREVGLSRFRRNYDRITDVQRIDDHTVRFVLSDEADRETPMILALMPVLSQAYYSTHDLSQTTLEPPLGSGPYRIAEVDPGRRIVYERVEDWWAEDLPVFRGHNNFDRLVFDYFRDGAVALEAFNAGAVNFRREADAETWVTGYTSPAIDDGRITMLTMPHNRPSWLRGYAFNTRRPMFRDPRVREALGYAFDFEWINRTLLHGQYRRINSMFTNSPLAPEGTPEGLELALLEPHRDELSERVFAEPYAPPTTDGSGNNRANLRAARALLMEAGWEVRDGRLTHGETGEPFVFEILLARASDERVTLAFSRVLERLGITATVRTVDSAQYAARTETYDFDMIRNDWIVTLSPGAEQDFYWGSRSAEIDGTRNYAGVREPAVDALIAQLADAADQETLQAAARALDRVLMWGFYVVPTYYLDRDYIAFWGDLRFVDDVRPLYGTVIETWWQAED